MTSMRRRVPTEEDTGSEASEWELCERQEREEESEAEAEELGAAGELGAGEELPLSYPRPPSWHPQGMRSVGDGLRFRLFFLLPVSFPMRFPWCASYLLEDRPGRRAKGSLQRAATARTGDRAMIWIGRMRVMIKQKKNDLDEEGDRGRIFLVSLSLCHILSYFLSALYHFWDSLGGRQRGARNEPASGGLRTETDSVYRHDLQRPHVNNDETKEWKRNRRSDNCARTR